MAEDKIKQAPEQEEFKLRDAACSPEFSNEDASSHRKATRNKPI